MNKKIGVLIILSFLFILVFGAAYSYSKYNTNVSGAATADVANWNITVNDCDIVNPDKDDATCFKETVNAEDNTVVVNKNFGITDFTYTNNSNPDVVDHKIAPGSSGTFKIKIKPNDTQVSIRYTLDVSVAKDNDSIVLYRSDPNGTNKVPMEEYGYQGLLQYTENGFVYADSKGNIRPTESIEFIIYVEWANDEKNNSIDTEIGTSSTSPVLDIPVSILFEQFLG